MTEPRKVWVCFEATEEELRDQDIWNDSLINAIRAALARKPDEEPWEGWDYPGADGTMFAQELTGDERDCMRHVLVIPLPEEKP